MLRIALRNLFQNKVRLLISVGGVALALMLILALDAVATIVGVAISQVIPLDPVQLGLLLGAFGGAFIAIGASHLLPEAQHRQSGSVSPLVVLVIFGALVVVGVRAVIP